MDDLDGPAGRGVAALRHDEPFANSGGGAESGEAYGVLDDGDLAQRRDAVKQGECTPFVHGVDFVVDAGDEELAMRAGGVELLVVHCSSDVAVFLGDGDHRAGVRRHRVLDETGGQVLVDYSIGLLGEDT